MKRFIQRCKAEIQWLEFVDKHTEAVRERIRHQKKDRQCELMNEFARIDIPLRERLPLLRHFSLWSLVLTFLIVPVIMLICMILDEYGD